MRHPSFAQRLAIVLALVTGTLLLGPLSANLALAQTGCNVTFTQPTGSPFAAGTAPNAIATADLNGDGIPDLAVVNGTSADVSIFLGNGSGGFTQAPSSPIGVGGSPSSIAVGNFNNDAFPDLAVGVPG